MREQRGHLSAEELRELNEFTVEDERVPSPEQIESNNTLVLPEIQTMTGYIRQHYEANIVEEAARKLRNGDLCVRHENRIYRTCPWLGPADYDGEEVEAILEVASMWALRRMASMAIRRMLR